MKSIYKTLFKHSTIYAIGQVLTRAASIIMIPVYTKNLDQEQFASISLMDFAGGVGAIFLGVAMAEAVTRYHFEVDEDDEIGKDRVWWTGMTYVLIMSTIVLTPAWFFREHLGEFIFDGKLPTELANKYLAIWLPALWFAIVSRLLQSYLRVLRWSVTYVLVSFGHLVLSLTLMLTFIIGMGWGVEGVLWANVWANSVQMIVLLGIFLWHRGWFRFSLPILGQLGRFGSPLVVTSVLSMLMHQADIFILRKFFDLGPIGVYSLAYLMAQGINTLVMVPFQSIWNVAIYEIDRGQDSEAVFCKVYEYFCYLTLMIMFGLSLFIRPILLILSKEGFMGAADIFPVVCLGYLFFTMANFFNVPAFLKKRSDRLVPAAVVGAVGNVSLNYALIPVMGPIGAAWASVVTFIAFSFVGLVICRRIQVIRYPIARVFAVICGVVAAFVAFKLFQDWLLAEGHSEWWSHLAAALLLITALTVFLWRLSATLPGGLIAAIQSFRQRRAPANDGPPSLDGGTASAPESPRGSDELVVEEAE